MCAKEIKEKEERDFILNFIEFYRSLPALWNVKSKFYSDRQRKKQQYALLLEKYRERYPDADGKDVNRKINILRSNFKREANRLKMLYKSGSGDYESKLWYFDAMSFINDVKRPISSSNVYNSECEAPIKRRKVHDVVEDERELNKPTDDFDRLGETWASKMRKMDSTQQLWAEKFINEILLEGQLGNLYRHSVQIVEYPPMANELYSD